MKYTKADIIEEITNLSFHEKEFIPGETPVPVSGSVINEQDILHVMKCALGGWFTEGKWTDEFTKALRESLGNTIRYVQPTTSGSSANLLAVATITQREFGTKALRPGDEVITSAVGFPTTASSIIQAGLVPVYVDPDFPTYNPSVESVENAITDRTKAIFMAHTLGNPFDLEKYRRLADEEGLWLLGDCCDALGSTISGVPVGSVEDISTLSFFPAHHITSGEGGAVLTNSGLVSKVVDSLRSWGRACWCRPGSDNTCGKRFCQAKTGGLPEGFDHKYQFSRLGYNLKWTDLQAALALSQVGRLNEFTAVRKHNWKKLRDGLSPHMGNLVLPEATKGSDPNWFGFCITVGKSAKFSRAELIQHLDKHKIGTRMLFGGNLLSQPGFQKAPGRAVSPKLYNADAITTNTFWIGVSPNITDGMIDYTLQVFEDFMKRNQ